MHTTHFKRLRQGLGALCLSALLTASLSAQAAETYYTDDGHTEVRFGWNHSGVSRQHGSFDTAKGVLELDPENVETSKLTVTIDVSSLHTGVPALNKHLLSADFFDVEKYPEITFVSTDIKRTGENTADVTGNLTLHGVTKPITLKTTLTHVGEHPVAQFIDYYKGEWVAFHATAELDNMEFNVGAYPTGPILIEINTELKDREN